MAKVMAKRVIRSAPRKGKATSRALSGTKRRSPSAEVDKQLARYRSMRDFAMTAEPRGGSWTKDSGGEGLPFVIQKHAATRLHYDFRLGWRGVLKSWAVTKGPSYNPADKRLAVEVEDHPIEYGGFEGTIPKGQYGGGTVMVWDEGTWEPLVDVDEGLRKGNLKFVLYGKKLHGRWVLVRMHGDRFGRSDKPNWLLIKEHDEVARGEGAPAITDEAPESAVTGRNLEEIAEAEDHVWDSTGLRKQAAKNLRSTERRESAGTNSAARRARVTRSRSPRADSSEVAGVRLSNPDKILDEESRLTKRQLAEYYAAVAKAMLPHIAGRPLSVVRCPEGSTKPCFFQKHVGAGMPEGVESVPVRPKKGGASEQYLTVATMQGLAGLAQMGVLEIHPWGSRNEQLETPDRLILDLDPDPALPWVRLVESAEEVREVLKQLGLESWVKSTGGKGLHIVAPLEPERDWAQLKEFAHNVALMLERADPERYLSKMTKSARSGRIFVDYLRNERGATAVAPFSPRARAGARVAIPLTWAELPHTDPKQFSVANFSQWKSRLRRDPWARMEKMKQRLTDRAMMAAKELARKSAT